MKRYGAVRPPIAGNNGNQKDNEGGFLVVKTARRACNAVIFIAAVVVVGALVFYLSSRQRMEQIHEDAELRLESFSSALFAPTDKYSYLPKLVASHPFIIDALAGKGDLQRLEKTNQFLEQLNASVKSDTIYITDDGGLTIASSNWNDRQSFVGKNFSYRPYFVDAMRTGTGQFYGMGTVSFAPGYYISHEIKRDDAVLGVAVVKIDLTNLDERWNRSNGEVTVSDANGVIFLSSRKDWKYQPTRRLDNGTLEKLIRTRQYDGVLKKPMPIVTLAALGKDARIVEVAQPLTTRAGQEKVAYLVKSRKLAGADWTIDLYVPLKANQLRAMSTAMIVAGAFAFVLLLVLYLHQAVGRIKEREKSRAALEVANQQLEMKNRELQTVSDALHRISITDHLTGAYTRRFFFEALTKLMAAAKRHGTPLSIIMIDVDNFKSINDSFGHPVGDEVLHTLASKCREVLREADVFARFGGEEFIVALPDTDERAACEVAERLRQAAMAQPVDAGDKFIYVTISSGIAQYRPADLTIEPLIERADQALYAAKNSGRNRVVVH